MYKKLKLLGILAAVLGLMPFMGTAVLAYNADRKSVV
jgi:hypothetical protein